LNPLFSSMACLLISVATLAADEEPKKPWNNETDFSAVLTRGNSESTTIGFKNQYAYHWDDANFVFKAGGIRAESARFSRMAVGSPDDFQVIEDKTVELTDEKYNLSLKYDRKIRSNYFWFARLEWDRNEFAGIQNRYSASLGIGHQWRDDEKLSFKTDYGAQYTQENLTSDPPGFDESYMSLRASSELKVKIGETSHFKQVLDLTANAEETEDFRFELDNAVTAKINTRLALKAALLLVYDNQPSLEAIPLGEDKVFVEVDDLDAILTASLVITF